MSRLTWDEAGTRKFEIGVDHGVLFPDSTFGVAWSGLTAVNEKSSGGTPRVTYLDGTRISVISAVSDFSATIQAFSAPAEFARADGIKSLSPGLYQTNQKRNPFGFAYRTRVGNDIGGSNAGYKLHLIYGATAAPAERARVSRSSDAAPLGLSWDIETVAPLYPGKTPTAHFVFSVIDKPGSVVKKLEEIIYGTDTSVSYMPTIDELESLAFLPYGYGYGPYGHGPYGGNSILGFGSGPYGHTPYGG